MVPRRYASTGDVDFAGHVGFGLLVLVTLVALRMTMWHAASVTHRLIDLALAPEPLLTAERLNQSTDPRWSLAVLLVALPLFLSGFTVLAARIEDGLSAVRSRIVVVGLACLFVDTLIALFGAELISIFALSQDGPVAAKLLKMATTTTIAGVLLGYVGWEILRAAES